MKTDLVSLSGGIPGPWPRPLFCRASFLARMRRTVTAANGMPVRKVMTALSGFSSTRTIRSAERSRRMRTYSKDCRPSSWIPVFAPSFDPGHFTFLNSQPLMCQTPKRYPCCLPGTLILHVLQKGRACRGRKRHRYPNGVLVIADNESVTLDMQVLPRGNETDFGRFSQGSGRRAL